MKLSSYQKLKAKVQRLEKEQRILIMEPKSKEAFTIRHIVALKHEQEKNIMFGSSKGNGAGIVNLITKTII